jgi:hypothetical protein
MSNKTGLRLHLNTHIDGVGEVGGLHGVLRGEYQIIVSVGNM